MDDHPTVRALGAALEAWRDLLDQVTPAELGLPTPNPGWDVADVVDHSIAVTRKFTAFARGATDRPRTRDLVAADHRAAFDAAADGARAAWRHADPRRSCHLPFGTFPAELAAGINLFDLLAHGWDVAQATGATFTCSPRAWETGLDATWRVIGERRDPRHYAPEVPVAPGASAQVRLLCFLGRPAGTGTPATRPRR
ncbi:TIGR03086 family metal-binding protein [Actinoallomurus iriomotensis]|uniref:TIGR03086 family metal-binding protein n=1 Tax=Actinoallomurus iriomotensis TaxID=478107 RepID=UPI0025571370|nr:TIGR03086 family metal-binding protein [Actinoallomurus iriomotensis]